MSDSRFLVDTSAWLLALRKRYAEPVRARLQELLKEDHIITTGIIKLELLGGTRTPTEFQRLKSRLDALDLVETDAVVWEDACRMAFSLRRKGVTVPYTDVLIAACAVQANASVIHADAHFDLMSSHLKLEVESFVKEASLLVL